MASDVTVTMGAKDDGLKAALSGAEKGIAGLAKSIAGIATAGAGLAALKSGFDAFKGMADYAGSVKDLTAQTGLSAEKTMVWTQALKNAGLGAESLQMLMNRLQKAMTGVNEEGEPTNKAFEKLGVNLQSLRSEKPDQQLDAIAESIAAISDPAERASVSMELFGKSGGRALAVFTDSEALTTARTQLGDLAKNLGANIDSLDKLSDSMNAAGEVKSIQFMAGFAKAFSGDMESAADAIDRIDFSKDGEELGKMAAGAKSLFEELRNVMNIQPPSGTGVSDAIDKTLGFGLLGKLLGGRAKEVEAMRNADAEQFKKEQDSGFGPLAGDAPVQAAVTKISREIAPATEQLASSLSLMTDALGESETKLGNIDGLFTDISSASQSTVDTEKNVSSVLGGQVEQKAQMLEIQDNINAATEKQLKIQTELEEKNKKIRAHMEEDLKIRELENSLMDKPTKKKKDELSRMQWLKEYNQSLEAAQAAGFEDPFSIAKRSADAATFQPGQGSKRVANAKAAISKADRDKGKTEQSSKFDVYGGRTPEEFRGDKFAGKENMAEKWRKETQQREAAKQKAAQDQNDKNKAELEKSKGQGKNTLETTVGKIQELMEELRDKLPTPALTT